MTTQTTSAWVPDLGSYGARLALVRQHMGWNMKEAARECGLPQNSWLGWESTGHNPRDFVRVSEAISKRTGATVDGLLPGQKSVPQDVSSLQAAPAGYACRVTDVTRCAA